MVATAIFWVEHETGHFIDVDYPWFKFLEESTEVNKYLEMRSKSMGDF